MEKQADIGCLVSSRRRRGPAAVAPLWISSHRGSTWCTGGNKVWQTGRGKKLSKLSSELLSCLDQKFMLIISLPRLCTAGLHRVEVKRLEAALRLRPGSGSAHAGHHFTGPKSPAVPWLKKRRSFGQHKNPL